MSKASEEISTFRERERERERDVAIWYVSECLSEGGRGREGIIIYLCRRKKTNKKVGDKEGSGETNVN
jgi:hypothetical protein